MNRTEFLASMGCYPDEMGNMPCDNGVLCDRCITREAIEAWNRVKDDTPMEITATVDIWQLCPNCPCHVCGEDADACSVHCDQYQAWEKVRAAFDHAEELAAQFLDGQYKKILAK